MVIGLFIFISSHEYVVVVVLGYPDEQAGLGRSERDDERD